MSMDAPIKKTKWYLLEENKKFSESLIWKLQDQYFADSGIEAWRKGEVPHYITSNPTIANSYAEIVISCWKDCSTSGVFANPESVNQKLVICELGAGSGRFAYHFLNRLTDLCRQHHIDPNNFLYVLTDVTPNNIAFWKQHPKLSAFIGQGILDTAMFDLTSSPEIQLECSKKKISQNDLNHPLIVVANYVFDSIPQELFFFDSLGCQQCNMTLAMDEDPNMVNQNEWLSRLQYQYHYQTFPGDAYPGEKFLQMIIDEAQKTCTNAPFLFPATALRCLERLRYLSSNGIILLSADKGSHTLESYCHRPAPMLVRHGSFSLDVNFYAISLYCKNAGGLAMFPSHGYHNINICALLMLKNHDAFIETKRAYQRHIAEVGPDDIYLVINRMKTECERVSLREILALMRMTFFDGKIFYHFIPRLLKLTDAMTESEKQSLVVTIDRVWQQYFDIGEDTDLPHSIGHLFYQIDFYQRALDFFCYSQHVRQDTGTMFNMAICHQMLSQKQEAEKLLRIVIEYDPSNDQAQTALDALTQNSGGPC